jgi:hypothetical protein
MRAALLIGLSLVCLTGCGMTLQPAPWAHVTPGRGEGAVAASQGVEIEARVNIWNGVPETLDQEVTPILVTVTNDSTQPIRIRYSDFKLVSSAGCSYAALPPFSIEGTALQRVDDFAYPSVGFAPAPYLSPYYPGLSPFAGPFVFDSWYYNLYYPLFAQVNLPTGDMIQKALPEGVVQPQGRLTGYLYFENVGKDTTQVNFQAEVVEALNGRQLTSITIPFVTTTARL